ncbi:MAG: hypothetical protein H6685_11180 [Deltaproteobacteria bacterium]|nr:hypothetical protein [Deltaproteobacteria bacterium]
MMDFLAAEDWKAAEREIAGTFHLEILPVDPNRPQSIRFTVIEMSVSDFSLEDIRQVFDENRDQLVEFA